MKTAVTVSFASALLVLTGGLQAASGQRHPPPNILFIMSDDHAVKAVSAYGGMFAGVFRTPNIDRLAAEGIRLNGMYVENSICAPSRASILTGQHSHVHGVRTLDDDFDPARDNLAKRLRSHGYETAVVGKWHLHTVPSGFDYYKVLPGQGAYYDPKFKEIGEDWEYWTEGGKPHEGYASDLITDAALDWLDRRNGRKPFFLMLHHKAPHSPFVPAERHRKELQDVRLAEPESLYRPGRHGPGFRFVFDGREAFQFGTSVSGRSRRGALVDLLRNPDWATGPIRFESADPDERTSAAYQKYVREYLQTVLAVDENVGRVLDYLDAHGLADSTLVIYTSDQGMLLGEHDYWDKRWIYEESIRMPFLARLPDVIPSGRVSDELVMNLDLAPTLLEFAGAPVPDDMQGRSFRAHLLDPERTAGRDAVYYRYWMHLAHHQVPAHYGIRSRSHKLAFFYGLPLDANGAVAEPTPAYFELYDLSRDPLEMNNVYDDPEYAGTREDLKRQLLCIKEQIGDSDERYDELMRVRAEVWDRRARPAVK